MLLEFFPCKIFSSWELSIFSLSSFRIRKIVHLIVSSPYFDNILLALILISSALLAFEDVTDPDAMINVVSDVGIISFKKKLLKKQYCVNTSIYN